MVDGIIRLSLTDAGDFIRVFTLSTGNGTSRPLASKYDSQIEEELINVFGMARLDAQQFIDDARKTRDAERPISVTEGLAAKLVNRLD